MTYTTLGAAILLAYYATRDGLREVRLGVAGVVALGLLLIGFWPSLSTGHGLVQQRQATHHHVGDHRAAGAWPARAWRSPGKRGTSF